MPIIAAEVNVREVVLTSADAVDAPVSQRLTVNARAAGPRLGRDVQSVIKASKSGDWSVSPTALSLPGASNCWRASTRWRPRWPKGGSASGLLAGGGFVVLDTDASRPSWRRRVTARDVIRSVQQARRDAGLEMTDRMRLSLTADPPRSAAVEAHRELIMAETLAVELEVVEGTELRIHITA